MTMNGDRKKGSSSSDLRFPTKRASISEMFTVRRQFREEEWKIDEFRKRIKIRPPGNGLQELELVRRRTTKRHSTTERNSS